MSASRSDPYLGRAAGQRLAAQDAEQPDSLHVRYTDHASGGQSAAYPGHEQRLRRRQQLFTYSIDTDDPNGCTLQATEDPIQLADEHWCQVNSAPGWTTVTPFQFEVYTLSGDCSNSGRVSPADYSCVRRI